MNTSFATLVVVEARRALARRGVQALVVVALLGIAIAAVVGYVTSAGFEASTASSDPHVARLADYWGRGGETVMTVTVVFLAIGALLGGATVAAADWRAGTMTTLCTWEVRRGRLLAARFLAAGSLAVLIAWALQVVFMAAMLPTILGRGTTAGVDGDWLAGLAYAAGREALVIALAAVLGAAIASIGRNTTAALAAAFVYLAIVEGIVRGVWPERARWLIGENATVLLSGAPLDDAPFVREPVLAAITLAVYVVILSGVAVELFRRRDIAATG
jgi:hypothetical protein